VNQLLALFHGGRDEREAEPDRQGEAGEHHRADREGTIQAATAQGISLATRRLGAPLTARFRSSADPAGAREPAHQRAQVQPRRNEPGVVPRNIRAATSAFHSRTRGQESRPTG
jgi:hypothetical protein